MLVVGRNLDQTGLLQDVDAGAKLIRQIGFIEGSGILGSQSNTANP